MMVRVNDRCPTARADALLLGLERQCAKRGESCRLLVQLAGDEQLLGAMRLQGFQRSDAACNGGSSCCREPISP